MSKYHKRHQQPVKPAPTAKPGLAPAKPSQRVSLTPLAPLIVRSGRPYDSQADPARLPPPSTLAGCLRTAWADAQGEAYGPALRDQAVTGPLLARGDTLLMPKPADAHYFVQDDGELILVRSAPRPFAAGSGADLPGDLLPVRLTRDLQGKPAPGPAWWAWADWLAYRQEQAPDPGYSKLVRDGWSPPAGDLRTHVAIDTATHAAATGQLFQTQGLDLGTTPGDAGVRLLAEFAQPLGAGLVHLGGERRLAALAPHAGVWPSPPAGWWEAIRQAGGLSLTLVTPALFGAGYRPAWLPDDGEGSPPGCPEVRLRLRAAAVERWQPHSGWDLATQEPRANRKLIPAGAVFWCELVAAGAPGALQALWLASLSDDPQDRRDSFGLALPAAWSPTHAQ